MAGRPSKFNQTISDRICEMIAEGISITSISEELHLAVGTIYRWQVEFGAFKEAVTRARAESLHLLEDVVYDAAVNGVESIVKVERLEDVDGFEETRTIFTPPIEYAKWVLPRRKPEVWSEKEKVAEEAQKLHSQFIDYVMRNVSDPFKTELSGLLAAAGVQAGQSDLSAPETAPDRDTL
jgi:hypothetical protein